ncbi:MAG: hypothetical protein LAO09_03485 [Acidobacteriia bacterium]|nr:hypothetical protein [Terriglobia bacterium]
MTPRAIIKAWPQGEIPSRPLLMPILFSLGARLENLPLRDFQSNPTKIANALRQIRGVLKVDGLTCYCDPLLEAEALGCTREWRADGSCVLVRPSFSVDDLRQKLNAPESLAGKGRIPVACEVLQRLKVMLRDEPALVSRVTGPFTLAAQLLGRDKAVSDSTPLPAEAVEFAAEVAASVAKVFLEAGANVILLTEPSFPEVTPQTCEWYASLLAPVFNVIRFYEALPVLLLPAPLGSEVSRAVILGRGWDCVVCPILGDTDFFGEQSPGQGTGVALPGSVFEGNQLNHNDLEDSLRKLVQGQKLVLLTSADDVSGAADPKLLARVLGGIRALFTASDG